MNPYRGKRRRADPTTVQNAMREVRNVPNGARCGKSIMPASVLKESSQKSLGRARGS